MEEKAKILVVEDIPQHLKDAKEEMEKRIAAGTPIEVCYASDLAEAIEIIEKEKPDGIISDVFFPSGEKVSDGHVEKCESLYQILKEYAYGEERLLAPMAGWHIASEMPAMGVYLVEHYKDTPIVLCTSSFHHGKKTELVFRYAGKNKIPFIDVSIQDDKDYDKEAEHKYWDAAYLALVDLLAEKKAIKREALLTKDDLKMESRDGYVEDM